VSGQYLPIFALMVLAILFAAVSFGASRLLAPRRTTEAKAAPYECGIVPTRDARQRFPVRFFLVAMIFIVFDIELIFIYPWAVQHREFGLFGLVAMLIFAFAVFESFVYLIGNGALDWGPIKRLRSEQAEISSARTSESTIRRVGLEGRPGQEEAA
jgi:NADH-quinone oxidoreductase subunit A